jgi:hypothetical protein
MLARRNGTRSWPQSAAFSQLQSLGRTRNYVDSLPSRMFDSFVINLTCAPRVVVVDGGYSGGEPDRADTDRRGPRM